MGISPTDIQLETRIENANWASANLALHRKYGSGRTISQIMFSIFAWGSISFALAFLLRNGEGFWHYGPASAIFGYGMCMFDAGVRARMQLAAIKSAPIFAGVTKICLNAQGCLIAHAGYEAKYKWSHVLGIVQTDDAVLLAFGRAHFLPIEKAAFQDQQQLIAVTQQIEQWIQQSSDNFDRA